MPLNLVPLIAFFKVLWDLVSITVIIWAIAWILLTLLVTMDLVLLHMGHYFEEKEPEEIDLEWQTMAGDPIIMSDPRIP